MLLTFHRTDQARERHSNCQRAVRELEQMRFKYEQEAIEVNESTAAEVRSCDHASTFANFDTALDGGGGWTSEE